MKPTLLSTASEQARMAQLFTHVRDAVIMIDPAGVVGFWSAGAGRVYGRRAADALNRRYLDLLPPQCRAVQVPLLHKALEGEEAFAEWQTSGPDGSAVWLEGNFQPVHGPHGKRIGCTILLHDVTRWRGAEAALRESEARYRLLTENTTDLICRLNPDGVFLYASAASAGLIGQPPEALVGKHFREVLHEEDLPRVLGGFDRLRAGQAAAAFPHRSRTGHGSYVWCESTARAVRDPNGTVTELVTVTRSIEERRRLEAKLRHSQKLEAVGRLAGGVAHDFNNLLTVINGFSEMVLRGLARPDVARIANQVKEIRKAGDRASALTRQLLAFGRKQVQTRTRLNLNDVIGESQKLLGRVLGEDVEIRTALDPELAPVLADIGQVEQVLMTLVLNARDAMPDGGTLTFETGNVTFEAPPDDDLKAGEYAMLAVTDSGVGMDDATRARLFEPFFTTKELGKGSGLGLAMVYGIVKQSDGHIAIETERGRGTTVRVYLPRTEAADGPVAGPEPAPAAHETVLLVEDDDGVRLVTSALLKSLGYRVVEAAGGMDALRVCREHAGPIHLLLTDVVMPVMNGREVANRVREILPGVKTLFMSGYTDDSILRHGVLDDAVAFLQKPLSHEALRRKVREVLGAPASVG
jgi:two-component system cell cycle sensor histidine kinase/response regulator CckA